jgi:IS5 family transposase
VNQQLEKHAVLVRTGAIVDATLTDSPRKPKGNKEVIVVVDRAETNEAEQKLLAEESVIKGEIKLASSVDTEAAWIIKGKKIRYGYKKHVCTDTEGIILNVVTTAANESDMVHLLDTIEGAQLKKGARVEADKGYSSKANRDGLKEKSLRSGIMYKTTKNKTLGVWQSKFNKAISKTRYRIERTHGGIKHWFKTGACRYVGRSKTHTQHLIESMAYNLYRAPNMVFKKACA